MGKLIYKGNTLASNGVEKLTTVLNTMEQINACTDDEAVAGALALKEFASSGGGSGDVYSTDERVIGTFLGKPLYRKCFSSSFVATNKVAYVAHGITDLDLIVNSYGSCKNPSNGNRFNINNSAYFNYSIANANIEAQATHSAFANQPFKIILEYTKTTD